MDNLSSLLREAYPMWAYRRARRRRIVRCVSVVAGISLLIMPIAMLMDQHYGNVGDLYITLYANQDYSVGGQAVYYIDEFDAMGVI